MILVEYLGKTIELTAAEFETIMKCPNYKYITKLGDIIKGSDVTLNDISCIPKNSEELITCLSNCTNKSCKIDLGNKHFSLSSQVFNLPRTSIYSNKNGSLDLSNVKLTIVDYGDIASYLNISGVDISMTNNSSIYTNSLTPSSLRITNGSFNCYGNDVWRGEVNGDNVTFTEMSMTFQQCLTNATNFNFNNSNITFSNNKGLVLLWTPGGELTFNGGIYKFLNNDSSFTLLYSNRIRVINNPKSTTQLLFNNNSSRNKILQYRTLDTTLACPESKPTAVGCKNTYSFNGNKASCPVYVVGNINMVGGTWDFSNNTYSGSDNCNYGHNILIRNADISFDTLLNTYNSTADVSNQRPFWLYTLDERTTKFDGSAAIEISNNRISLCNGTYLEALRGCRAVAFQSSCIKYYVYDTDNKVYTNCYWVGSRALGKCKRSSYKTPPEYCIPPTS
tara:strand:- start:768 stop:2114 length:1347 start_codon:yes stop_codon:yes gene_type:complete